jgi:putative transposase
MYFVTICTKNREHFFGEIVNWKMILSEIWLIVQKYWLEIPNHFPFVLLNEFVVIQNHMHW